MSVGRSLDVALRMLFNLPLAVRASEVRVEVSGQGRGVIVEEPVQKIP